MTDNNSAQNLKPMPLEGIKVLECGVFHAGPGASAILGDLGADVIKIESGIGDPIRKMNNIGTGGDITMPDGESAMFQVSSRNKRGAYIDIIPVGPLKCTHFIPISLNLLTDKAKLYTMTFI